MRRTFFAVISFLLFAAPAWAQGACPSGLPVSGTNCFFIAASGSDTNAGTSEASPWAHAPGMPNCTGTCATTTPAAGEGLIFRGGDAWHQAASTSDSSDVPMGGTWTWTWSGSGGGTTCNYPSSTSTCIYLGVDTTWYNSSVCGSSFCRPQMEFDNPIWANSTHQDSSHNGFVTACTFEDSNTNLVNLQASDLIFDNFNLWGKCFVNDPVYGAAAEIRRNGEYQAILHNYVHGWTQKYNPQTLPNIMDDADILAHGGTGTSTIAYNVFDGSDAHCAGPNDCYGGPVIANNDDAEYFYNNVCRYLSNCIAYHSDSATFHDNLVEYIYESYDPSEHGNVFEMGTFPPSGVSIEVYNNIVRHTNVGVLFDIRVGTSPGYFFNNILYDDGGGSNCVQIENNYKVQSSTLYATNNTIDNATGACQFRAMPNTGEGWNGTVFFQNNHLIAVSSLSQMELCSSQSTCTWTDKGNEIFQTESVANGQGYTSSNNYQPTATSNATYHAGGNLSASCAKYSLDLALCSGSTGGVSNIAGSGTIPTLLIALPLARGTAWDAGAYQYSGSSSSRPNPPTGLAVIVK